MDMRDLDGSAYACAVPSFFTCFTVHGPKLITLTAVEHAVHRHEKAPIESLPVELLLAIFREVISIPNQFWSTLAYVCSSWKNIVLLMPEFWTHITVFIDAPFFSLSSVASAFARSSKFILEEVTVTRNTWTLTEDEREKERVASVLQIINSNMHRCSSISFKVLFSSSLPSFSDDFHGPAKCLEYLELTCMEDDGGALPGVETSLSATHYEPFRCPKLYRLVIDGRNYFNAWQRNLDLKEMFPDFISLSISHFTPVANRSESFTTSDLLRSLVPFQENLTSFSIDDVHLDESTTPVLDNINFIFFETIEFENMHNTGSMQQILDFIRGPADVRITRCRLYPYYNCQGSLSLTEIDACEDLVAFLRKCVCTVEKLTIENCPGFGDDVLHAMMTPSQSSLTTSYCMPHVDELSITDCGDFSISTLKRLVETRRICGLTSTQSPTRPIGVLLLSGRVPDVSPEDREWFKDHLSEFFYYPI